MKILEQIKKQAKKNNVKIILPEANIDERVKQACLQILKEGLSEIVVFGKPKEFSEEFNNPNCQIIDMATSEHKEKFVNQLYELRKAKGLTLEDAKKLIEQPIYFAMMMLKNGLADGVVAGAKYSTADVLRPGLQIIKTKPGKRVVTGGMLMLKENENPLFFGDVSLIENPTSEELSEIALANAEFMRNVINIEPKVAMLSYSTKGSAKNSIFAIKRFISKNLQFFAIKRPQQA